MIGVYFSGTGNTKYCVETFLREYDVLQMSEDEKEKEVYKSSRAFSIEDACILQEIRDAQEIVFGYPVYYSNISKMIRDFIENNGESWRDKKIFIIATMGLFSGDGAGMMARLLQRYGAVVTGGLHLKMPDNICDVKLLKRSLQANRELIKVADEKIHRAAVCFKEGNPPQDGLGVLARLAGFFGQRLYCLRATAKYSDKLKVDSQKCILCKKCISLCPMQNIKLEADKIVAQSRCTKCYRCLNHCPVQAITLIGKKVVEQGTVEKYLTE